MSGLKHNPPKKSELQAVQVTDEEEEENNKKYSSAESIFVNNEKGRDDYEVAPSGDYYLRI